jgi:hypothetical protein
MAGQRLASREIAIGARVSCTCLRTIQSSGIRDENNGGERSFSRRHYGAAREQIRKTRNRTLSRADGVRAFWPEAAKNFPLAVAQFRAGKCPHPPAQDPNKARQATTSWRGVRDRNAPACILGGCSNPAASLTPERECWRWRRRRRRRLLPDYCRPSTSQFRRRLRRSAQGQQYRGP